MERISRLPDREIIPKGIYEFYVRARSAAYAGGGEYEPDRKLPGFEIFRYKDPDTGHHRAPYVFEDRYTDGSERPGHFGGFEIIQGFGQVRPAPPPFIFYTYTGDLIGKGERLGEGLVYSKLQKFLKEHVGDVRFGRKVRFELTDGEGNWVYEGDGESLQCGWEDKERIILNGALVYQLTGRALCFWVRL